MDASIPVTEFGVATISYTPNTDVITDGLLVLDAFSGLVITEND